MKKIMLMLHIFLTVVSLSTGSNAVLAKPEPGFTDGRPRIIATSDGEIDDECSMVRFLLYANEWDIEGIVTSSSQYHWQGHRWAGDKVSLSAKGTTEPDGDALTYRWWQYQQADTYGGTVTIENTGHQETAITVPDDVSKGESIHIICEVTDAGTPPLTRYQRVVMTVER